MWNSTETFKWRFELSLYGKLLSQWFNFFPKTRNEVILILDYSKLLATETYFFTISLCSFLVEDWKNLPDLEMTILFRWFRCMSKETNIPAARSIILHAKCAPCFYSEEWEHSPEKPEWFNTMQNTQLGNYFHLSWASQMNGNEEGIKLSQQSYKHMECSRNLKYFTMTTSMNAKEEMPGNELDK